MEESEGIESEFLRDIIANKKDNTPRLIYADWLDENNQEDRANYIRLQVEKSTIVPCHSYKDMGLLRPVGACYCRYCVISLESQALFIKYQRDWIENLGGILGISLKLERGFISKIHMSAKQWMESYEKIVDSYPIEVIELHGWVIRHLQWLEESFTEIEPRITSWPNVIEESKSVLKQIWPGIEFNISQEYTRPSWERTVRSN